MRFALELSTQVKEILDINVFPPKFIVLLDPLGFIVHGFVLDTVIPLESIKFPCTLVSNAPAKVPVNPVQSKSPQ